MTAINADTLSKLIANEDHSEKALDMLETIYDCAAIVMKHADGIASAEAQFKHDRTAYQVAKEEIENVEAASMNVRSRVCPC